jgi:phosphoribosylformimino-5-aminoimidazole carboxamide ribotide isomerase
MQVLPVLDVLNGIVVRGVAGRRAEYRALRSQLVDAVAPLEVARALRRTFGFQRLYVADLDGIQHQHPHWTTFEKLINDGFQLLVDAGLSSDADIRRLKDIGCEVVLGMESSKNPEHVARLAAIGGMTTFSLDLSGGELMLAADAHGWCHDPLAVARQVIHCGISRLIVLDLADVGMGRGTRTRALCSSLLAEFPELHLTSGGGVRGLDDLRQWRILGADQILVASALHDGNLTPQDISEVSELR